MTEIRSSHEVNQVADRGAATSAEKPLFSLDLLKQLFSTEQTIAALHAVLLHEGGIPNSTGANGAAEGNHGMGYKPESAAELATIPKASPVWGPFKADGTVVFKNDVTKWNSPAESGSGDSAPSPVRKTDGGETLTINSGAGSRATLFNTGERHEQTVTVPPIEKPVTPARPSSDEPAPQINAGPGSRAHLFNTEPHK